MTAPERKQFTTAEISLIREARQHLINRGFRYRAYDSTYTEPRTTDPVTGLPRSGRAVTAALDDGAWSVGIDAKPCAYGHHFTWHKITSVAQAIDLIVQTGLLPQRFHSAYRAGWHAAEVWAGPTERAEFVRLFQAPENISFPAGENA